MTTTTKRRGERGRRKRGRERYREVRCNCEKDEGEIVIIFGQTTLFRMTYKFSWTKDRQAIFRRTGHWVIVFYASSTRVMMYLSPIRLQLISYKLFIHIELVTNAVYTSGIRIVTYYLLSIYWTKLPSFD